MICAAPSVVAQVALQGDGGCTEMPFDCQLSDLHLLVALKKSSCSEHKACGYCSAGDAACVWC